MINTLDRGPAAADGTLPGGTVVEGSINEVLAAEQQTGNLRAHEAFAAAEAKKIDTKLGVTREVRVWGDARGLVDHEGDSRRLANLEDLGNAIVVVPGGVDHGGPRCDGGIQILYRGGDDQPDSGEPDAAIPDAAAAHNDDLSLHARGVGQLVNVFGSGAGDAACRGAGDRARRAGCDHAGFGPGHLGEMAPDGRLQLKKIDEEVGSFFGGLADLGEFDRGGEVGEDAAAVDDRTNAKAGVDIVIPISRDVGIIPAAEAATVEARLRAPRETKRGAAATSFMNDRRLFCSSLSGDMMFLSYCGKIEWVMHKAGRNRYCSDS